MTEAVDTPLGKRRQPTYGEVVGHERLTIVDHPLGLELLARLRDIGSDAAAFGIAASQLATHLLWEATRDLSVAPATIPGFTGEPLEVRRLAGQPAAVVILRAGEVFSTPVRSIFPTAPIFHLGVARDERTLDHHVYSDHVPADLGGIEHVLILDPMLATGGSIVVALERVRAAFDGDLTVVAMVSAPLGVTTVLDADNQVRVITAALDERLDENGYILPGLGDAGDRFFGTTSG